MGALRFKTDINGSYLDNSATAAVPPWSSVRELLRAAEGLERNDDHTEVSNWLTMLMAPGSSLGGARPKANILDKNNELWIAKFPSKNDTTDKAAWEYVAYKLAVKAGITMAPSKVEKLSTRHHTFFTKRFDREGKDRIHFASAMTMTGNTEESIRDSAASYLDIAEFIQTHGAKVEANLHQLWRRLVFNIAISNTDDHLRNHGFLLTEAGWVLSPAYDLNPSIDKAGLALNIDMDSNGLDYDLARSVGPFFRLNIHQMDAIIFEVHKAIGSWRSIARSVGLPKDEIEVMQGAFRY